MGRRTVQSLSACTRVHFTLPQCLYKGALYLTLPLTCFGFCYTTFMETITLLAQELCVQYEYSTIIKLTILLQYLQQISTYSVCYLKNLNDVS